MERLERHRKNGTGMKGVWPGKMNVLLRGMDDD